MKSPSNDSKILIDTVILLSAIAGVNTMVFFDFTSISYIEPGHPIRFLIGAIYLLFLPGYSITTAFFPARPVPRELTKKYFHAFGPSSPPSLYTVERVAISFGLSVSLLPIFGMILTISSQGITARTILIISSLTVILFMVVGSYRRLQLPVEVRYNPQITSFLSRNIDRVNSMSWLELIVNLTLAFAILLVLSTLVYGLASPNLDEQYTEFMVHTNEISFGDATKTSHLQNISENEAVITLKNKEGDTITYTIVVLNERVGTNDQITDRVEMNRFTITLEDQEQSEILIETNPELSGENIRFSFLLFKNDNITENPNQSTAYRDVHIWLN